MATYLASFSALLLISDSPLVSFLYVLFRLSNPSAGTVSSEGQVESKRLTRPIVSRLSWLPYVVDNFDKDSDARDQQSISATAPCGNS